MTWATCVPILVFLGLSVLELFPMYATRQTKASLNASALTGRGHNKLQAGGRHDMPSPLYAARCGPAPAYTRLTPGLRTKVYLLLVAVGATNIHDARDRRRQMSDDRQHHCLMPPPMGRGHNNQFVIQSLLNLLVKEFGKLVNINFTEVIGKSSVIFDSRDCKISNHL